MHNVCIGKNVINFSRNSTVEVVVQFKDTGSVQELYKIINIHFVRLERLKNTLKKNQKSSCIATESSDGVVMEGLKLTCYLFKQMFEMKEFPHLK